MREALVMLFFAALILMASSQWAEMLGKFINSSIQMSRMGRSEVTDDSLERFRKQVLLLRVQYEKAEEERVQNVVKTQEMEEDFDALLVKRRQNMGQLMQGVLRDQAQGLQKLANHPAPDGPVENLPAAPPPDLPELKILTQQLVSDATTDLKILMEQYDLLDEQRKMVMENMKANLNSARERGRQAQDDYQSISRRLSEEAAANTRSHIERFEQLQASRNAFMSDRNINESKIKEVSQRIKDQMDHLKSSLASSIDMAQFNSMQDQRADMLQQQMELNRRISQNARQLNETMSALELSTLQMAESRGQALKDQLTRAKDFSFGLFEQQRTLMDNIQRNMDEQRGRNEQRMQDIKDKIARMAEISDINQERMKIQMENMKYKQAENKDRIAAQMQMVRDKIDAQGK